MVSLLTSFSLLWLVSVAQGQTCDLECPVNAPCTFGEASFDDPGITHDLTSSNGMHCACPLGWTGVHCDIKFDSCDGNHRCYHGGSCIPGLHDVLGNEQLYCDCSSTYAFDGNYYVGKYCEHLATFCDEGDYCVNDGTCTGDFDKPCRCPTGFQGPHCEYAVDSVPDCKLDCQNGGRCQLGPKRKLEEAVYHYWDDDSSHLQHCECPAEFDGKYCEIPKEKCGSGHCFHDATCLERVVDGVTLHNCECPVDQDVAYAGRFCQYQATSYCTRDVGLNGHLFCVNDGICRSDPYDGCKCPPGFSGFSCELVDGSDPFDEDVSIGEGSKPYSGEGIIIEGESPPSNNIVNQDDNDVPIEDPDTDCSLECQNFGVCRMGSKDLGYMKEIAETTPYLYQTHDANFQHCVCRDGFTGLYCEHEVDVCGEGQHICLHGSTCVRNGDEHLCDCLDASTDVSDTYAGLACQHAATDICTAGDMSPGHQLAFCVNGGICKDRVAQGEPHPGCYCEDEWKGPHCEIHVIELKRMQSDSSSVSIGKVFAILLIVGLVLLAALLIRRRLRRKKVLETLSQSASVWKSYRDRPSEVNIAPARRQSEVMDNDDLYVQSISSSNAPMSMAAPVTPNGPDLLDADDEQPKIYIGPPRDEDGHELHNVEIL